jgi:hypothetical protein
MLSSRRRRKNGQIFSSDLVIAVTVFIFILITSAWFWDTTKEKIHMTEVRNDIELISRNSVAVLVNTVGDPPNWHDIAFTDENIYSIGISKNRPWLFDEDKVRRLDELNTTDYELIKRILGVRGAGYEFFLNISKYNLTDDSFVELGIIGKSPNGSAAHVVNVERIGMSDYDDSWVRFNMKVWSECIGAECY